MTEHNPDISLPLHTPDVIIQPFPGPPELSRTIRYCVTHDVPLHPQRTFAYCLAECSARNGPRSPYDCPLDCILPSVIRLDCAVLACRSGCRIGIVRSSRAADHLRPQIGSGSKPKALELPAPPPPVCAPMELGSTSNFT